jgi:hypothetical protein
VCQERSFLTQLTTACTRKREVTLGARGLQSQGLGYQPPLPAAYDPLEAAANE